MPSSSPGFFSADHSVYTITEMFPKRPWQNFLWNDRFIATIDQFGCGGSWHRSGETAHNAGAWADSRLIFLREKNSGAFWAANRNFLKEPFDEFYTEVGQGYSRIVSRFKGLRVCFRIFIPRAGNLECWTVEIENTTAEAKEFSLFAYAGTELSKYPHCAYNNGKWDEELGGVVLNYHSAKPIVHFFAADRRVTEFETTNRRFRGVYGALCMPDAVKAGRLASEETSFDNDLAMALQFDLKLEKGEKRTFNFLAGLCTDADEARQQACKLLAHGEFDRECAAVESSAREMYKRVAVQTPDSDINALADVWLKRQIDLGKTWARGYSRGFRDIMQDTTALTTLNPETAAQQILYCLPYQYPDGNTLRMWEPIDRHPYRDGAVWLILAVTTYLKESGRFEFLNEKTPYFGSEEDGTVLDHCRRGMRFLLDNLGSHGLCLWGGGDWNDSINTAGLLGRGESVWLSQATILAAREFARLLKALGHNEEAQCVITKMETLAANLRKHAWDKDHFICGYNDWNEKIGSYENAEAQIYLNMQTWGVLADAAEDGAALMDLVERELSCPWGYLLNKPSYSHGDEHIGRVSYFEKGSYENGSVYVHGCTFKIAADCALGRGDQAYRTVKMILATNPENPAQHSGVEPYVITNMYLGPANPSRTGESIGGWITGSAGWLFRGIIEFMLGVQADYDGLTMKPCLPRAWKKATCRREYRGSIYLIEIHNPLGLETGTVKVQVDGKEISGIVLPIFGDGKEHQVSVMME